MTAISKEEKLGVKEEKKSPKRVVYLDRDLKYYRWSVVSIEGRLPELHLYDKERNVLFVLNKVYAMSLHKFIPNYLDKMRIEQVRKLKKNYRKRIKKQKELKKKARQRKDKAKEKKQELKKKVKNLKKEVKAQQNMFAKGRKVKE